MNARERKDWFVFALYLVLVLALAALSGCSGPLSRDDAILTLPVPDAETDCQIRVGMVTAEGGTPFFGGSMTQRVVTIIGAANCPPGTPINVPTTTTITIPERAR